jgi:formylglycine-generating enzyme required for sulfatase activity
LRHWGRDEQLRPIDQWLATGQVEGRRGWYLNKQGQTFTILEKPHLSGPGAGDETAGFAIASTEVTVAQFREFRDGHKVDEAVAPTPNCPVNFVSWYDAVAYCNWLSEKDGIPRDQWCYLCKDAKWEVVPGYLKLAGYRLPTEAEWEYACRAGAETRWCCGEVDEEIIGRYAQWYGNAQAKGVNRSFPVATLKPNDFGLFDMHGNVGEWCQDVTTNHAKALHRDEEAGLMQADGEPHAVVRGGNYTCTFRKVSCDSWGGLFRNLAVPFAGFRPARTCR